MKMKNGEDGQTVKVLLLKPVYALFVHFLYKETENGSRIYPNSLNIIHHAQIYIYTQINIKDIFNKQIHCILFLN